MQRHYAPDTGRSPRFFVKNNSGMRFLAFPGVSFREIGVRHTGQVPLCCFEESPPRVCSLIFKQSMMHL